MAAAATLLFLLAQSQYKTPPKTDGLNQEWALLSSGGLERPSLGLKSADDRTSTVFSQPPSCPAACCRLLTPGLNRPDLAEVPLTSFTFTGEQHA